MRPSNIAHSPAPWILNHDAFGLASQNFMKLAALASTNRVGGEGVGRREHQARQNEAVRPERQPVSIAQGDQP